MKERAWDVSGVCQWLCSTFSMVKLEGSESVLGFEGISRTKKLIQ
jgi:hypothetical protein